VTIPIRLFFNVDTEEETGLNVFLSNVTVFWMCCALQPQRRNNVTMIDKNTDFFIFYHSPKTANLNAVGTILSIVKESKYIVFDVL
jgi:hypothetical protein